MEDKENTISRNELAHMAFKDKLKFIRIRKNISRKDLSKKSGISESAIQKYELGIRLPKIDTIKKIAVSLEVPTASLMENPILATDPMEEDIQNTLFQCFNEINEFESLLNLLGFESKFNIKDDIYEVFDEKKHFYLNSCDYHNMKNEIKIYALSYLESKSKDPNK